MKTLIRKLSTIGPLFLLSLGCSSGTTTATGDGAGATQVAACGDTKTLELFCSGPCDIGGSGVYAKLFAGYAAKCPQVGIATSDSINQVSGTSSLDDRFATNNPPDMFWTDSGQRLTDWAGTSDDTSRIESLSPLFESEKWTATYIPSTLNLVSTRGKIFAVPLGFVRENNVYYNVKIFKDNNLSIPKTWDEFLALAETLKAKNIQPLSLAGADKDTWTSAILFESVMIGELGADYFTDFYAGKKSPTEGPYRKALEKFVQVANYAGANFSTIGYTDTLKEIATGKAAMTIMGGWAGQNLAEGKYVPDVDYGVDAAPGTRDVFVGAGAGWMIPRGAKNRNNAFAFFKFLGSREGQEIVAREGKTISARTDVSAEAIGYDAPTRRMAEQFKTARLLPNMPAQTPEAFLKVSDASFATLARNRATPGAVDVAISEIQNVYGLLKKK